mmetsp:Transcript_30791/g.71715  ORF Transcript_30791/g.71715 Transcript_30791/m.71715 type:complete len:372 (-) Transcript_30791:19-1134(-)
MATVSAQHEAIVAYDASASASDERTERCSGPSIVTIGEGPRPLRTTSRRACSEAKPRKERTRRLKTYRSSPPLPLASSAEAIVTIDWVAGSTASTAAIAAALVVLTATTDHSYVGRTMPAGVEALLSSTIVALGQLEIAVGPTSRAVGTGHANAPHGDVVLSARTRPIAHESLPGQLCPCGASTPSRIRTLMPGWKAVLVLRLAMRVWPSFQKQVSAVVPPPRTSRSVSACSTSTHAPTPDAMPAWFVRCLTSKRRTSRVAVASSSTARSRGAKGGRGKGGGERGGEGGSVDDGGGGGLGGGDGGGDGDGLGGWLGGGDGDGGGLECGLGGGLGDGGLDSEDCVGDGGGDGGGESGGLAGRWARRRRRRRA